MSWKPRRTRGSGLVGLGLTALSAAAASFPLAALADSPTPGFPEPVVQWGVQKGDTCDDVARALYGDAKHAPLVQRYNKVSCAKGQPLAEGLTLVMPAKPTKVPDATLRSMRPDVEARAPGGGWSAAGSGQPLVSSTSVHTLEQGRADIQFIDRTRVFMAPNTLVVIYGTASQTQVSKTPPPAVEVQEGEVRAGLAALRGGSVEVAVQGGGRVSANSRDAVVQRKGTRTTVAVFDGKADVSSGGKTVGVPTNHGTRFVGNAAPSPPRPLPPPPAWDGGGASAVALSVGGESLLAASWKPVSGAIAYRVELARDEGLGDLVAREEVGPDILRFRAEKLPAGTYFLAVRAIDKDEYLGVANRRVVTLVEGRVEGAPARIEGDALVTSTYATLSLAPRADVELAIDDGPFAALGETRVDFGSRAPKRLRLRRSGTSDTLELGVRAAPALATLRVEGAESASANVHVALQGSSGVEPSRLAPELRVTRGGRQERSPLTLSPGGDAVVPLAMAARGPVALVVVDARGRSLGAWAGDVGPVKDTGESPAATAAPKVRLGLTAPLVTQSTTTGVVPWVPVAPTAVVLGAAFGLADADAGALGHARASGAVGPVGLELGIRTNASGEETVAESGAFAGLRYAVVDRADGSFAWGPALRVAFPTTSFAPPVRLEPGLAFAGLRGRVGWLLDGGARFRASEGEGRAFVPDAAVFALGGLTYDLAAWARGSALLDAHWLSDSPPEGGSLRGGVALGLELGTTLFGSASARVSPWSDGEGHVTVGLAAGVRAP